MIRESDDKVALREEAEFRKRQAAARNEKVLRLHRLGQTVNDIHRSLGRGTGTITRIIEAAGLTPRFDQPGRTGSRGGRR